MESRPFPLPLPIIHDSGFRAAEHLPRFLASNAPTLLIIGDSLTELAENVTASDLVGPMIEQVLIERYPTKDITFKRLACPGKALADFTMVAGTAPYPAWLDDHERTWASYAEAEKPSSIVIVLGINSAGHDTLSIYQDAWKAVALWKDVPDIVLVSNITPNPDAGEMWSRLQAGCRQNAALIRTLVQSDSRLGIPDIPAAGLVDVGRYWDMAVFGQDPVNQVMTLTVDPGEPVRTPLLRSNPIVATRGGDFDISVSVTTGNDTSDMVATLNLTEDNGNAYPFIAMAISNGVIYTDVYTGIGLVRGHPFHVGLAGAPTIEIAARGAMLTIAVNGTGVLRRMIPRGYCGFTAMLNVTSDTGDGATLTINRAAVGTPRPYAPLLSLAEAYGEPHGPNRGNGINHPSSFGYNYVFRPVFEAILSQ